MFKIAGMNEVRAIISNSSMARAKLTLLNAEFKGKYAFQDCLYHSLDREFDWNVEFVRMRLYKKTNWLQKPVELAHKVKEPGRTGTTKFKIELNSAEEAAALLKEYRLAFSFHRTGFEYEVDGVRVFLEEIEGLPPSVELLSANKEKLYDLMRFLEPLQILSDSIPKLISSNRDSFAG